MTIIIRRLILWMRLQILHWNHNIVTKIYLLQVSVPSVSLPICRTVFFFNCLINCFFCFVLCLYLSVSSLNVSHNYILFMTVLCIAINKIEIHLISVYDPSVIKLEMTIKMLCPRGLLPTDFHKTEGMTISLSSQCLWLTWRRNSDNSWMKCRKGSLRYDPDVWMTTASRGIVMGLYSELSEPHSNRERVRHRVNGLQGVINIPCPQLRAHDS